MQAIISKGALPLVVETYLAAIVRECAEDAGPLVSVILVGSAATGGFSEAVSDVDLILVVRDGASREDRRRLRDEVTQIEIIHGLREHPADPPGALAALVARITGSDHSVFVCSRADLLSGRVERILDLHPVQAFFVDRIVLPSILSSAVPVWGEPLPAHIAMPPIRRLDVFKAFFGLSCQAMWMAAIFPVFAGATKCAMDALRHSVHNCFFCYRSRTAPLIEEVEFFERRLGPSRALRQLLALRRDYRPSFAFVIRCLPALVRLHLRTALDNRFPITP